MSYRESTQVREVVYTPEPAVWHPWRLLRRMAADSWRFRELVRRVIVRDLRSQYRQSLFGYLWAFIPPIATAIGFSLAREADVLRISDTHVAYAVFVMVGTVLWQTFVDALNGPIEALNNFKPVLSRIYVPPEIVVFAKLGEVCVNLSIKLLLLGVVFVIYDVQINATAVFAPVLVLLLIIEASAIGLLLAPLASLYHDVTKGLPIILSFWFLLTPVVYPPPQSGRFSVVVNANPATHFIVAIRNLLTGAPVPNPSLLLIIAAISIVAFIAALVVLRVSLPFVIERTE